jgi:hypothetical protein
MTKHTELYFVTLLLSFNLQILANIDSIPPYYQKRVQLTEDFDKVLNVANTQAGGNIICGGSWSVGYSRDAVLMKTDKYGEVEWAKRVGTYDTIQTPYGQNYEDGFNAVGELPDESIIGIGPIKSNIIFQDSSVTNVCRFSKDGELLWSKGFEEPSGYRPFGKGVVPLPSGNFLIIYNLYKSGTKSEIVIAELTLQGDLVWSFLKYLNLIGKKSMRFIYLRLLWDKLITVRLKELV